MGYVVRLKRNQLVGGNNNDEIYPITSTNAIYREGGKNLEDILDELGNDVNSKKVTSVTYSEQDNSIQVKYSNGDVNNYTLNIQKPNNGKLTLTKGNNVVEFTANSADNKSIAIPNVSVNTDNGRYPKHSNSIYVDGQPLELPALVVIPTFGIGTNTNLLDNNELTDAIIHRNIENLTDGPSDVCAVRFDDNNTFLDRNTAVILPRLPKLVAAVSMNGNALQITYLEDKVGSSQTTTDIPLPSGGSTVTVSNKNATLNAGGNVTVATVTVDNSATDLKVNIPNFVVNNNSISNIEYCASESAYNSSSKNSNTLYFIPVS